MQRPESPNLTVSSPKVLKRSDVSRPQSGSRIRPDSASRRVRPISGKQDYENIDKNLLKKVDLKHRRF